MKSLSIGWNSALRDQLLPKRHMVSIGMPDSVALGEMCDIASGIYADEYVAPDSEGATPYIRVNNVREFVPNLTDSDMAWVSPKREWGKRVCVAHGDVVIARTGTLGRAFVVPPALENAVMSQHITRLRLHNGSLGQAFLVAGHLNSALGKTQVDAVASGTTRLELTHAEIEQIRIPRFKDPSDKVASAAQSVIAEFSNLIRSSQMAASACRDLIPFAKVKGPPEREWCAPFSQKGMSENLMPRFHQRAATLLEEELQTRYECRALGELAQIRRGAGTLSSEYERSGLPYIRTSSIVNFGIELFPEHYGSESLYRAHRQSIGAGDVLLTMEGKIGAVAYLGQGERCLIKNHIEFIRVNRDSPISPEFLFAFLLSPIGQAQIVRRTVVQTTIPGLGSQSRQLLLPIKGCSAESEALLQDIQRRSSDLVRNATLARLSLRTHLQCIIDAAAVESGSKGEKKD